MKLRRLLALFVLGLMLIAQGCGDKNSTTSTASELDNTTQAVQTETEKKLQNQIADIKSSEVKGVYIYDQDYKTFFQVKDAKLINGLLSAIHNSKSTSYESVEKHKRAHKKFKIDLKSGESLVISENEIYCTVSKLYEQGKVILTGAIQDFIKNNQNQFSAIVKESVSPKAFKDVVQTYNYNINRISVKYLAPKGWVSEITDKNKIASIVNFFEKQKYSRQPEDKGTIKKAKKPSYFVKLHTENNKSINIYLDASGGKSVDIKHVVYTINDDYSSLITTLQTAGNKKVTQ